MRQLLLTVVLIVAVVGIASSPAAASLRASTTICTSSKWSVDQNGDEIRIFHQYGSQFPQYGVLDLASSYFRLNYGPGSGWGTSVVLFPAFWSSGQYYQGARVSVTCTAGDPNLVLTVTGTIAALNMSIQVTLSPPTNNSISANVEATVRQGSVSLDNRPGEAFKLVTLSSMRISSTVWDTSAALADVQTFPIPSNGWIISPQPAVMAQSFGLEGGTSGWKTNAPSILIGLSQNQQIAGWVTSSTDPNDDNVGLWAASNTQLSSWRYQIIASDQNPPGKVTLIAPSGTIDTGNPTFTWTKDEVATWYYLEVKNSVGTIVHQQWYQETGATCPSNCAVTPNLSLSNGAYTWRVQTWGPPSTYGPWSDSATFTVRIPRPTTLLAPLGTISTSRPTFLWTNDGIATSYHLLVFGSREFVNTNLAASQICLSDYCEVTLNLDLPEGDYEWWLHPSAPSRVYLDQIAHFTVVQPGKVRLRAPSGPIDTNNPTFTWTKDDPATWYYLEVKNSAGATVHLQWYEESSTNCPIDCAVTPNLNLPSDTYTWRVQTWGPPNNFFLWSEPSTFTVFPPSKVTLLSPLGTIDTNKPIFIWTKDAGATWYYLEVKNSVGTIVHQQWYEETNVNCPNSNCAVTPNLSLPNGSYTWRVQTWGPPNIPGPWSSLGTFAVFIPPVTPLAPSGTINTGNPTFTWSKNDVATWYYLEVKNAAGATVHLQWYEETAANCPNNCAVTPNLNLPSGNYTWRVQWWSPSNPNGPWSDPLSFTVPAPGKVTLIAPSGTIDTRKPTFTWTKDAGATWYLLEVKNAAGTTIHLQWYDETAICPNNCAVTPNLSLSNGTYTWRVQTWGPPNIYGPWSDPLSFTVNVPPSPGAATLIAPVGTISADTPTFTWTIPTNTTRVYLWLNGPAGKVYAIWYNTSDICTGSTCAVTPATPLSNGSYQWWIQTSGPGGDGPWSAAQAFTVNRVAGGNVAATATPTQVAPTFEPPKP